MTTTNSADSLIAEYRKALDGLSQTIIDLEETGLRHKQEIEEVNNCIVKARIKAETLRSALDQHIATGCDPLVAKLQTPAPTPNGYSIHSPVMWDLERLKEGL